MPYTHSFLDVTPPARYDAIAWTRALVEESTVEGGTFTQIAALTIAVDPTPASPNPMDLTVTTATLERGWFRFRFDAGAGTPASPYTNAVYSPLVSRLSLAELKDYLGPIREARDEFLRRLLNGAFIYAGNHTGRQLEKLPAEGTGSVVVTAVVNGRRFVRVPDARTITAVELDDAAVAATGYQLHSGRGGTIVSIELASRGTTCEVTGTFGLDPLPADLKEAIYVHAAASYHDRESLHSQRQSSEEYGSFQFARFLPVDVKRTYDSYIVGSDRFGLS